MLIHRNDRPVHMRVRVIHRWARPVDEMGTDFVEKPLPARVAAAQDRRCAVPEAKAVVTKRAELAYQRAGERSA